MKKVTEISPFFIIIAIVAITGNSLVLLLFLKKKTWLKKTHNCLLFALAVQDVLTGFCMIAIPNFTFSDDDRDVPENAFARELYCRLVWSQYLVFSVGITSIYTCVGLSMERWLAVFKPIYYRTFTQARSSVAGLILVPWLLAFAVEIGTVISVITIKLENSTAFVCCWDVSDSSMLAENISQAVCRFLGIIIVPAILVAVSYIQIIRHVRKLNTNRVRDSNAANDTVSQRGAKLQKVTAIAFMASASVVLFWLPSQFHFMLVQLGMAENNSLWHKIFKVLAFSNSCLNPFIYCFSKASYRKGVKGIVLQVVRAAHCYHRPKLCKKTRYIDSNDFKL